MALITAAERSELIALFVGMFNAAPGSDNLNDMVEAFEDGADLYDIAASLATRPEFVQVYQTHLTAAEFADQLADALLPASTPAGARTWAENWVVTNLQAGVSRADVIASAVKALAVNTNADFNAAETLMNNKVAVAEYYSVTKVQSSDDLSELQAVLNGVTEVASTVDTAKAAVDGIVADATGRTFTLTAGEDEVTGTAGNDKISAPVVNDGFDFIQTLNNVDVVDGGDGTDTLNVTMASDSDPLSPTLIDVEVINIRAVEDAIFQLKNATGVTQVWNQNSTADWLVISDADLDDVTIGARNTTTDIFLSDVSGDELNLVLDNADIFLDSANDNISEISINVLDDSTLYISEVNGIVALNIAGTGELDLTVSDLSTLEDVDASTFANDLTLDLSDAGALESVVTGAGDDDITVDGTLFSGGDQLSVDLGDGSNTLVLANVDGSDDLSALAFVSDDENLTDDVNTLALLDDIYLGGSDATLNLEGLDDLEAVVFEGDIVSDGSITFDNGPATLATTFEGWISSVDLDFADQTDLTLAFEGGVSDVTITGADLETATISFEGYVSDVTFNTVSDTAMESLTVKFIGSDGPTDSDADFWLTGSDDGVSISSLTIDTTEASDLNFSIYLSDAEDLTSISILMGDETDNSDLYIYAAGGNTFGSTVTIAVDAFASDIFYTTDNANGVREIFEFTAAFDGTIEIDGFSPGVGANGDRIDLSAIAGIASTEDLIIEFDGTDTTITAEDDQFDGTIIVLGQDISNDTFNFIL